MIDKNVFLERFHGDFIDEYWMLMKEIDGTLSVWQSGDELLYSDLLTESRLITWSEDGFCYRDDNFEVLDRICGELDYESVNAFSFWEALDFSLITKETLLDVDIDATKSNDLIGDIGCSNKYINYLMIKTCGQKIK